MKHKREDLFNGECGNCEDKAHSQDQQFTYVDISTREEPYRIKIETKVCLRCGPVLIFEIHEDLADYLEEALQLSGYDLDSELLQIQTIN